MGAARAGSDLEDTAPSRSRHGQTDQYRSPDHFFLFHNACSRIGPVPGSWGEERRLVGNNDIAVCFAFCKAIGTRASSVLAFSLNRVAVSLSKGGPLIRPSNSTIFCDRRGSAREKGSPLAGLLRDYGGPVGARLRASSCYYPQRLKYVQIVQLFRKRHNRSLSGFAS